MAYNYLLSSLSQGLYNIRNFSYSKKSFQFKYVYSLSKIALVKSKITANRIIRCNLKLDESTD